MTIKYFFKLYMPDESDKVVAKTYGREGSWISSIMKKNT
jgi:hypothetical protein